MSRYFCTLFLSILFLNDSHGLLLRMSNLASTHSSLFNKIKSALDLKPTEFASKYDAATFSKNGFEGTCEWWDETKGSKLTGVSSNVIQNKGTGFAMYSINCWMGPAYNCPHMLLSLMVNPFPFQGVGIRADLLARGPTPLGSDQTVVETYYGKEVIAWYDKAVAITGATPLPPLPTFSGRLLRSPVELAIAGLDESAAASLTAEHVERWLQYVLEAKQNEARSRGAINTRDDKQRQYQFRAELFDCTAWVGADFGGSLGAARTGPIAEAYVGGGG